ncbi:ABC transporter permease [Cellulomonas fimi]|uniref:ABC transporter permease n=1 Tax=Cellulomonas fimi TaxID=1708 RepID=UPI00234D9955|nr:ABC transporter permease [Cellulomonas fimi]MDC7122073.1 ABC transporter permease [Cellulomonas fimi]
MSAPEVYEVPNAPLGQGRPTDEARLAGASHWRLAARRLRRNPGAIVGAAIVVVFILVAVFAPLIAPYDAGELPGRAEVRPTYIPGPSDEYLLGLDRYGADLFSQLVWGARASLLIGVLSTLLGLLGGLVLGALSGGLGGATDNVIMRFVDLLLAVPSLLLAVSIAAIAGQTPAAVVIAIGVVQVPIFARLLRGSMFAQRGQDYVLAARSLGLSKRTVTMSHVLPNSVSPVIVQATLLLATAVIEAAALSYLGLGGGSPTTAEWGRMLTSAQNELEIAPRLALWPGACIAVTALGFTLFGEALREALDPRSRKR